MTNTPFSKKCEILGDYYASVHDNAAIMSSKLMADHRDIFLICLAITANWVSAQDRLEWHVSDTWDDFCDSFGVDKYGSFSSLQEFLDFANE